MIKISKNLEDTKKFAREFLESISKMPRPDSHRDGATVVGLYGNLGSGKTTFAQCVAEALGVTEHVTSPTFVIMKSYKLSVSTLNPKPYNLLLHIDAYRLKNGEELRKLRFEELLRDSSNLVLIEWADLVSDILPKGHAKLYFEFASPVRDREGSQRDSVSNGMDETTRKITF